MKYNVSKTTAGFAGLFFLMASVVSCQSQRHYEDLKIIKPGWSYTDGTPEPPDDQTPTQEP